MISVEVAEDFFRIAPGDGGFGIGNRLANGGGDTESVGQSWIGIGTLAGGDESQTGEYLPLFHLAVAAQSRG